LRIYYTQNFNPPQISDPGLVLNENRLRVTTYVCKFYGPEGHYLQYAILPTV